MKPSPSGPVSRPRGRPRLSAESLQANQALVLAAAARLFATCHSQQLSVEMLLQDAGISRASFYRWFPGGLDAVLDRIIQNTIQQLVLQILLATQGETDPEQRPRACIRAYFDWAMDHRAVVAGLYREAFDAQTLVYGYRRQAIVAVTAMAQQQLEAQQLRPLDPLEIETMILWIETASMVLFRNQQFDPDVVARQREFTSGLFLAMFQQLRQTQPVT